MKMNKVILGMAAAIGLASTNVMALPLSQYDATGTNTLRVFASGASAQDQGFERWFRLQCAAGTLDIYRDGSNQRMFFCNINSTGIPGFPTAALGGKKVAMFKSSVGGSGNGVQPVANQTLLGFLNPPNITGCVTTAVPASGAFAGYNDHLCTAGTLQNAVSDAGISDVEPKLFGATAAEIGRLAVSSQNAVIWGVPVTTNLRNALQTAQGLVAGSDTEANMPTLSRQQVTSVYAGQLTSWDDFTDPATGNGLATTAGIADANVYLCRRVASSGTQASFEVNFLRQRCTAEAPVMMSALNNPATVSEGSGTSNVISCLNGHNTAGRWAMGLFSTENQEGTGGWRFVKVDGRAPTLLNVVKGGYPYFSEQSIQWRKSPATNLPTGLTLTLLNNFKSEMGSPAIIANLNQGFNHAWGQSGLLALPTNGHLPPATPYTAANVTATPVSSQSKSYVNGSPNNCLEPALFAPQHAGG